MMILLPFWFFLFLVCCDAMYKREAQLQNCAGSQCNQNNLGGAGFGGLGGGFGGAGAFGGGATQNCVGSQCNQNNVGRKRREVLAVILEEARRQNEKIAERNIDEESAEDEETQAERKKREVHFGGFPVPFGGPLVSFGGPFKHIGRSSPVPFGVGGSPVAFEGSPVPFGGSPVPFGVGGSPVAFGGSPVGFGGSPVPFGGSPVAFGGSPVPFGGSPVAFGGSPVGFGGSPVGFGGSPVAFGGSPIAPGPVAAVQNCQGSSCNQNNAGGSGPVVPIAIVPAPVPVAPVPAIVPGGFGGGFAGGFGGGATQNCVGSQCNQNNFGRRKRAVLAKLLEEAEKITEDLVKAEQEIQDRSPDEAGPVHILECSGPSTSSCNNHLCTVKCSDGNKVEMECPSNSLAILSSSLGDGATSNKVSCGSL